MPKQVIVIMQENYPFGECEECTSENTRVLVRKIYELGAERGRVLEKVGVLRKLRNEHMIKIESVLQQEDSIHFLFQYIPIKLETWISNINDQFIENFRDQLIKFSSFLANHFIRIDFQLRNIGMDQNYGAKYFLDLNFEVDSALNREKLKSNYIREITNLFRPYITHHQDTDRHSNDPTKPADRKVPDSAISPPTNKASSNNNSSSNNKNKEKALAQYYQEVNMSVDSENEKILQEFMDVLDNEEEEEVKAHTPPPKQTAPQPNHFQKQPSQPQQKTPPPPQKSSPQQELPKYQQGSGKQNSSFQQSSPYQSSPFQSGKYQEQYEAAPYSQFSSAQQLPSNPNPFPQFHTQNNLAQNKNINSSQSIVRAKNEPKEPPQSEKWRESADLQNRVKSAIEKSMNVIKKFKGLKDESMN